MKPRARSGRIVLTAVSLGAASAWLGCNLLFDIEAGNVVVPGNAADGSFADAPGADTSLTDAPDDAPIGDAGGDRGGPIYGKQVTYFASESTISYVNVDFTKANLAAYVQHDDGGADVYPMTVGKGDGTFRIDGVPAGAAYYVQFPPSPALPLATYAFSDSRTIDLSSFFAGRSDTEFADAGADAAVNTIVSTVTYDFRGLAQNANDIQGVSVFSMGAAGTSWGVQTLFDPLPPHQQPFPGSFSYDPDGGHFVGQDPIYQGTPLISGVVAHDKTYVIAAVQVDAGVDPNNRPIATAQAFSTPSFVTANGVDASLSGTFVGLDASVLPDGGGIVVTWDRSSFVQATGDISAANTIISQELTVTAAPFGDAGFFASSPALYDYPLFAANAADPNVEQVRLVYGDPYPANWARFVGVTIIVHSSVDLGPDAGVPDGGTSKFGTNGFIQCTYRLEDVVGKTVRPLVSSPRNVRVNGSPSDGTRTGIGTEPVVEWDAPTLGPPTSYAFTMKEIAYDPARRRPGATAVGFIATTPSIRRVRVPPGILKAGHRYTFSIRSTLSSTGTDAPALYGFPVCVTNATTGLLSP